MSKRQPTLFLVDGINPSPEIRTGLEQMFKLEMNHVPDPTPEILERLVQDTGELAIRAAATIIELPFRALGHAISWAKDRV